ncbi:hypothetical protein C8J57DRAFT_1732267 [Mycena rebaudengoi]|nr:hypothetical protein C8J57DRAFT_1732267 [Mycena rebaudengoi]
MQISQGHKKRLVYNEGPPAQTARLRPRHAGGRVLRTVNITRYRDIVLAARRGNPHPIRAEYIVSTSSKELLPNLEPPSPVWRTLKHPARPPRAITDINWHPAPAERDLAISTGVDSWIWAWDRGGGLSAFNCPLSPWFLIRVLITISNRRRASQMEPLGPHILASSHAGEVLIWDRRTRRTAPSRLRAHRSKIYGIDWSPALRDVWDAGTERRCTPAAPRPSHRPHGRMAVRPGTSAPWTWRQETLMREHAQRHMLKKRTIPHGVTLPRVARVWARGAESGAALGDGPGDVGPGGRGAVMALITWSKDRIIHCAFGPSKGGKVGCARPSESTPTATDAYGATGVSSFPGPNRVPDHPALAHIFLPQPPAAVLGDAGDAVQRLHTSLADAALRAHRRARDLAGQQPMRDWDWEAGGRGGGLLFWTRGPGVGGGEGGCGEKAGSVGAGVNVDEVAGGAGEGGVLGGAVVAAAAGRGAVEVERAESVVGAGGRGAIVVCVFAGRADVRSQQPCVGEVQAGEGAGVVVLGVGVLVLILSTARPREEADVYAGAAWTGGGSSSVFPSVPSEGLPEQRPPSRNAKLRARAQLPHLPQEPRLILRKLRAIRERWCPCLEACLRSLSEGEKSGARRPMDSDSRVFRRGPRLAQVTRDLTVSLLRSHKSFAEPRTSQGTFGPNGELVCFFRDAPRIVCHILRDTVAGEDRVGYSCESTTASTPLATTLREDRVGYSCESTTVSTPLATTLRRVSFPLDSRRPQDGDHILCIITNLLTFSHDSSHHCDSESSRPRGEEARASHTRLPQMSTAYLVNIANIARADRKVAIGYIFEADTLTEVCRKNAEAAREHGRYDHERIFKILQALFPAVEERVGPIVPNVLIVKMITRIACIGGGGHTCAEGGLHPPRVSFTPSAAAGILAELGAALAVNRIEIVKRADISRRQAYGVLPSAGHRRPLLSRFNTSQLAI